MRPLVGRGVLVLSAMGYPLTEAVIRRFGRPGATVVGAVCAGLLARDTVLIVRGTPRVLRRAPAVLLWLEAGAAAGAAASTLRLVPDPDAFSDVVRAAPGRHAVRRGWVAALFALHTVRFGIYLTPDHGMPGVAETGAPSTGRH
jgi:hypothetical protein